MKSLGALTLALAALVPSAVVAAPAPAETSAGCLVPQVIFSTLDKPFTLTALAGSRYPGRNTWSLLLNPREPSDETPSKPVISRTKIAPPSFRLTDGKLTSNGIEANDLPTILIFPPVLRGWVFGGGLPGSAPGTFTASYACDADDKGILILRAEGGASGFAVQTLSEKAQVFIKPQGFAGRAVDVQLRINQQ